MRSFSPVFFSRSLLPTFKRCALGFGIAAAVLLVPAAPAQSAPGTPASDLAGPPAASLALPEPPTADRELAQLPPSPLAPGESSSLPDAPSTVASLGNDQAGDPASAAAQPASAPPADLNPNPNHPKASSPTELTVLAGQIAPHQTARDKLVGAARDSGSPFSIAGELISAGYAHVRNSTPNYGTDGDAFAQRFGASVARGTSQKLFSDGAMASLLHEDPRYYQMGNSQPFFKRVAYAATRPLVTRTDSGKATPNIALLTGYLGAAALTKVYYPQPNQGFSQTLQTYGGSIGGAALGFVTSEFLADALEFLHLKKVE